VPYLFALVATLAQGADDDLAKAVLAIGDAGRYRFTVQEGGAAGTLEGTFQKGIPLHVKSDGIEFFRQGAGLVYRDGQQWRRTRTGTLSDPLRILGASAKARAVRLPHEELAGLTSALRDTTREKREGETLVRGTFGPDAARDLARGEDRDLARGGTARLWLDGNGRLTRYKLAIQVRGRRGNADVDGTTTKTITVRDVGMATVEVPADARKVLE
jgi:hypothetical protein